MTDMTAETETRSRQHRTKDNYANAVNGIFPIDVNYLKVQSAKILIHEILQTGTYEANRNVTEFTNGIYLCNLNAGNFKETKRMILLK